jgi:hypothetical protein
LPLGQALAYAIAKCTKPSKLVVVVRFFAALLALAEICSLRALDEDGEVIPDCQGVNHVVGDEDNGNALLACLEDDAKDMRCLLDAQRRGRLIEDEHANAISSVKLLREDGVISAANASQICDGASGALVVNERALKQFGVTPIARIDTMTVTAGDPVIMLEEPINATRKALRRAGMKIADIDLYEVNGAFAPVPLAWLRGVDADPDKINVNGGAIALGHPLGASGTKLMATLINALRKRGNGLQTTCEGGGLANVTIVEALS